MRSPKDSKGFILWGSWMPVQKFHSNLFYYWVHQQEGSVLNSTGLCPVCTVSLDFLWMLSFSPTAWRGFVCCVHQWGVKIPWSPIRGFWLVSPTLEPYGLHSNTAKSWMIFSVCTVSVDCLYSMVALRFKTRQYFSKHDDISRNKITVRKMWHVGSGKRWDNISCLWLDGIKAASWLLLTVGNNLTMYKYSRCTFSVSIVKYCQHQS